MISLRVKEANGSELVNLEAAYFLFNHHIHSVAPFVRRFARQEREIFHLSVEACQSRVLYICHKMTKVGSGICSCSFLLSGPSLDELIEARDWVCKLFLKMAWPLQMVDKLFCKL